MFQMMYELVKTAGRGESHTHEGDKAKTSGATAFVKTWNGMQRRELRVHQRLRRQCHGSLRLALARGVIVILYLRVIGDDHTECDRITIPLADPFLKLESQNYSSKT